VIALRNIVIIALLALLLTILPGGGNLATGILTAISLLFFAAMAMVVVRLWKETSLSRDAMTDRQRGIVYGSLGAIALMVAGTDELLDTGVGLLVWLVVLGTAAWLIFSTWREANAI
jgi:hypothetical protein